jgi:hypothetical protein
MKHSILLSALCAAAMLTVACTDDFFDLQPHDKISSDIMYKTAQDFNLAVVSCYSKMQGQVAFYTECCEYRSDNLFLSAPTAGTQDRYDIDHFRDNASNGLLADYWANFNNNVYRCNMVLDRIDGADIDETLKKQYKGEAQFIRAYTYFNMYRVWGGVPTTKKVVTVEEALKIGRSTNEQMLELIAGDLQQIVDNNLLPATYSGNDIGRVTSGAALTLLGKVYLTFHKWTEARDVLAQVIGKYALQPTPADVFDVSKKMNSEIIFAVRFNKSVVGEGHGFWHSSSAMPTGANINQTLSLRNSFTDPNDLRKNLIAYKQVVGESGVYLPTKFYDTKDAATNNVGNDQILLRYADVLLMYAEALNMAGFDNSPSSLALQYLNEVRTRAACAAIASSDPAVSNQAAFNKAIMEERQREFPYEGHRWFDLVRMGGAVEATAAAGITIADYQLLFPIPKTEMERINNTALLWQNPGYE